MTIKCSNCDNKCLKPCDGKCSKSRENKCAVAYNNKCKNTSKTDIDYLNVNKLLKRIGMLFRGVDFRYKTGSPSTKYKVGYTMLSADGLKVPTDTIVCRPFAPDYTQTKFSFSPLVEYVRTYKALKVPLNSSVYQEAFSEFLQKYYSVVDFLMTFPVYIDPRYLYNIELYGGLNRVGYVRLANLLSKIRKILLGKDGHLRNLIIANNGWQASGILALKHAVDATINKNSVVYNKLSVAQQPVL